MKRKLNELDVEEILTCGGSNSEVARHFGLAASMVSRIRAGLKWKHVHARVILGEEAPLGKGHKLPFDESYCPVPETGCWLWFSTRNAFGYGLFGNILAHRESYERHVGPIPPNTHVLHKCDTPCCVNPLHLSVGSHRDNMEDRQRKNRTLKGSSVGNAKLTEGKVRLILSSGKSSSALSREFGVTGSTVRRVRAGKIWKHVTFE